MRQIPQPTDDEQWQEHKEEHNYEDKPEDEQAIMRFGWVVGRYTDLEFELFQREDGSFDWDFAQKIDLKKLLKDGWETWGMDAFYWIIGKDSE